MNLDENIVIPDDITELANIEVPEVKIDDGASPEDADVVLGEQESKEGKTQEKKDPEPEPRDAADEAAEALKRHIDENKKLQEELSRAKAEKAQMEQSFKKVEISSREALIKANETAANKDKDVEKSRLEQARKEAIAFQEVGDFEKAEEARERAVESRLKLRQIDDYLTKLEEAKKEPISQEPQGRPDPVTGLFYTQKTQDWIDSHAEQWKDPEFRLEAQDAHAAAISRGLQPDTDAYFAFCNKKLGVDRVQQQSRTEETTATTQAATTQVQETKSQTQTRAPSIAPSRNVPNSAGAGTQKIKLTGEQRAIAQDIINAAPSLFKGMTADQVYAQEIAKLQKERGEKWWEPQ